MDYLAGLLELIGLWLIGSRISMGFIISLVGNVGWVLYVMMMGHSYGLLLVVVPAMVVNVRNYIKWRIK